MTVYEALTVALIMVLAAGTTVAIYVGMANWIGACYMVRCSECHHLTFASANQPQASCAHCRHPMLLHPLYATQHPGHTVRVLNDRLRY
ncbi:hypothetical protein [Mycolicibacterium houstonense]|uniref:hypothetical protein n=1 Tax=Mycolicibacterium houstonense TaxID=146021 RepID=UPI000835EEA0|nr:hypothetical protein [Mycolicibacterium houstonense]MCV7066930.1 hypothetical protein [Mycolicibacterium farcinogenes]